MSSVKTISAAEAWQIAQRGDARLVDVREPGEFNTVRIPIALNFPLSNLENSIQDVDAAVPARTPIFVLCAAGPRAVAAAAIFRENGREVLVVDGGMTGWLRRGLPVEQGSRRVWDMDRQVRFIAGLLVLTGTSLGFFVNQGFFVVPAFVGGGLIFSGVTGFCGMAHVLARMPWNRE